MAKYKYISELEYLNGRGPIPQEFEANMHKLLEVVNKIREDFGKPLYVSSGYRPPAYNARIKGAPNSDHIKGFAIDIADLSGEFRTWLQAENRLEKYNIWIEDPDVTKSWCHITVNPKQHRVFKP